LSWDEGVRGDTLIFIERAVFGPVMAEGFRVCRRDLKWPQICGRCIAEAGTFKLT
jgi:hypothetical protein